MVNAPNFPEGFRAGYDLRGFTPGRARFPLSPGELEKMGEIRSRIACLLADCGFAEAAHACQRPAAAGGHDPELRLRVETLVREALRNLNG